MPFNFAILFLTTSKPTPLPEMSEASSHLLGLTNDVAAAKAGYSKKSGSAIGCMLLNRKPVATEIRKRVTALIQMIDSIEAGGAGSP